MFIVSESISFQLRRSGTLLSRILTYNISLRWSFCLWVRFRIYKHSAPPELKRFYFRVRKTFSGLTSLQLRSTPCSNSAFNSATVCIFKFGSSMVS